MLAKDSMGAQKWCYRSLHLTSLLHHDSSAISWADEDFLPSLFCSFGLGRNARKYTMVSHQWAQLVPLWVVLISKMQQSTNSLLPHREWNSFRNSIISGPPFWSDSSQIPARLHALCCTWFYIWFLSFFFSGIITDVFIKKALVAESRSWCRVCAHSLSLWAENFICSMCAAPRQENAMINPV